MADLFAPVSFRSGKSTKNRLALAPLTNGQSNDDGTLTEEELRWLVRRARGGFGLVETCASHVSRDGQGFDGQLGVFDDSLVPGLSRLARGISEAGALGLVQLYHGGVRSPSRLTGAEPLSASAFSEDRPGFEPPRAAGAEDIERIIDDFGAAARRAERAGFAGVEIHGAHGYLLGQFLSREMNLRTDAWGGALEGRARLLRAVTARVRATVSSSFIVGVRLSPEDFGNARGLDLDDSVTTARWLAEDGADFVHVSLWDYTRKSAKYPDAHALPLFRSALPSEVVLVAAGKVWTRADAEALLGLGADLVAVGRAAILDPDWPEHVRDRDFQPLRGPLSPAELAARDVSPRFVEYLRRFKNIVSD
ncbi:MAG: NADH:flavin oxidoreductase [Myxococcales bacterium]|nr:NADH:flavin oxidoreductase [Myxococcales bacterium]